MAPTLLSDKALAELKADFVYGGSLPAGVTAQEARKHGAPLPQNGAASAPQATGQGTGAGMAVKDGRAVPLGKYGCYNRPAYADGYYAPDGRDSQGRIIEKFIPFTMSLDCKTYRPQDERCADCKHQPTK